MKRFSLNKGAMFGLDARIALAIFGALSVISGASLYSAIQDAKMTTFYTNLVEIEKAVEHLYLDVGSLGWSGESLFKIGVLSANLTTTPFNNWKGPYIQAKGVYGDYILLHPYFSRIWAVGRVARTKTDSHSCTATSASSDMNIYIRVDNKFDDTDCNGDLNYLKNIHDKYDTDGDYRAGKIKVIADSTNTDEGSLFYRIDTLQRRP